jgi:hypothetical protein
MPYVKKPVEAAGTPETPVVVEAPTLAKYDSEDAKAVQMSIDYMRDYYAAQPKVMIKLPETTWFQKNGYTLIIKGGERVAVPQGVADELEEIGRI